MALCNLLTVLLFSLYPSLLQAQISFSLGNVTYWSPGSLVKLPWTYNIPKANILAVEISFTKSGSSTGVTLARGFDGDNPTSTNSSQFTIEEQATLVFQNANLGHNGTYALAVLLRGGGGQQRSEVKVVILEQPIAKQTCSKQNGNFYCECKSDVGNPPPLAYWSKNGKKIGDFGYKEKKLTIDNITKGEAAIYSCNVKSHNLTDQKNISVEIPTVTSFVSEPEDLVRLKSHVTFKCKANGILPTMFNISFNGKDPERIPKSGVKTIDKFTEGNVGVYQCIAFNIIGSDLSQELKLNITEEPTGQPTSKTTTNSRQSPTSETTNKPVGTKEGSDKSGLGTGAIVGIVIGSLFVVILIAALIYWFCCKRSSKSTEQGVPVVSNADGSVAGSLPRANDDNAYECVDQEKLRREAAARNEGNDDDGDGSTLPPVYAVVDKTKKKREKKPAQPTYASLDPVALQPDSSKMRDRSREETNYASINLDSLQSDLV